MFRSCLNCAMNCTHDVFLLNKKGSSDLTAGFNMSRFMMIFIIVCVSLTWCPMGSDGRGVTLAFFRPKHITPLAHTVSYPTVVGCP